MRALNTENIPAQVRSGYVDLSFHAIVAQEKWPGLRVIPYMEDPLVAICAKNHRFAANKSVRLETLSQESFVDLTPERTLRKVVDQGFALYHLRRTSVFEVSDVQTALQFVGHGLGVSIVPAMLARSSTDSGQIRLLRILEQTPRLPKWRIAILTRPRKSNLPGKSTVDLFLEALARLRALTNAKGKHSSRIELAQ